MHSWPYLWPFHVHDMMFLNNNVYFALGSFQEQLMKYVQKIEVLSGNDDQVQDGLKCSLKSTLRITTTPLPTFPFSSTTPKQTLTQTIPPIHKPPYVFQEQPINANLDVCNDNVNKPFPLFRKVAFENISIIRKTYIVHNHL